MVFIGHKEIVEVASHLLGRSHCGINIEFIVLGESRKNARQHMCLNVRCQGQLCSDSFFFSRDFLKLCDILSYLMVHFREGIRKIPNLIIIFHKDFRRCSVFQMLYHIERGFI